MKALFSVGLLWGAINLLACAQSTITVEPAKNEPIPISTTPTSGTLTLNVSFTTDINYQNQKFSALLFKSGVLVGGLNDLSTTDATGVRTVVVKASDPTNDCLTATDAILPNGTYDLYFAINYQSSATTNITAPTCGANGWLMYSANTFFNGARLTVTIKGNTSYLIEKYDFDNTLVIPQIHIHRATLAQMYSYTFSLSGLAAQDTRNVQCYLFDALTTLDPAARLTLLTRQPIGKMTGVIAAGAATLTGIGANLTVVPSTFYRYLCLIDAVGTATAGFTDVGDLYATGTLGVDGAPTNITSLTAASFTALP